MYPALELVSIGELSQRSGVAASALRFYEERGLIRSERTRAGHRRYARATARRVSFIVFAQRVGLSLEEIREELAKLPTDRVPGGDDWAQLTGRWTARIDQKIAELERLRGGLDECIGCGCLSLERCAIINPGDRAGKAGPGPRYWSGDARPSTGAAAGTWGLPDHTGPVPANRSPADEDSMPALNRGRSSPG